jgi:hypothetical protein
VIDLVFFTEWSFIDDCHELEQEEQADPSHDGGALMLATRAF